MDHAVGPVINGTPCCCWEMQGVELQFYFCQHVGNPPLVTEQGRQNWGLFLACWDLPFFSPTFFFFFFCYPKAGSEAVFSCQWGWARLQQGQDRAVVRAGPCAGGAELPLESCWWPGQWDKRCAAFICLWSIPSLANSSVAACHLGGIEMFLKWPFWFPFLLPALFLWKLLHSGCCQFKSLLNHSKRVCRISVLSVTYTVLPGPFLSVTEK